MASLSDYLEPPGRKRSVESRSLLPPESNPPSRRQPTHDESDWIARSTQAPPVPLPTKAGLGAVAFGADFFGSVESDTPPVPFQDPNSLSVLHIDTDFRKVGRRKAIGTFIVIALTIGAIISMIASVLGFINTIHNRRILENQIPKLATAEDLVKSARLIDEAARKRLVQIEDELGYMLTLMCGLYQFEFQKAGLGIGQLLKSCSEMEIRAGIALINEIAQSSQSPYEPGKCYTLRQEMGPESLFCMPQQVVEFPSSETTGLLPETSITRLSGAVPFPMPQSVGEIPVFGNSPYIAPSFYSNPQLGSLFLEQERVLIEKDLYGIFVVFSYNTLWNINKIDEQYSGTGFSPVDLLPFDGVFYVSLNTRYSTTIDGAPGSFGQITAVFESGKFDGLGKLYVDDELVVLSGLDAIVGWDISGGLDASISRPTVSRDFIVDATEIGSVSLASPGDLKNYIDPATGKRYMLVAMEDSIDTSDPGTLFCDTIDRRPGTCGGFAKLERDSIWQNSPASATTRFTPDLINNGMKMPTPGDFVTVRERNLFIAGSSLSRLYKKQDDCLLIDTFVSYILDQAETIQPPPDFNNTSPIGGLDETSFVSFYRYEDALYLFNLSSLWDDAGDILKDSPLEFPNTPPYIEFKNHLFDAEINPINEWKKATGFMPTLIRRSSSLINQLPVFYGIDFYTGGIFAISPTDPSSNSEEAQENENVFPWKLVYVGWLPYVINGETYDRPPIYYIFGNNITATDFNPLFLGYQYLPFPMDLKFTTDGRFMFVAASGLGQVIVFRRPNLSQTRIEYCDSVQVTSGQYNYTRLPYITHPARPGIPLYGAPASLSIDPTDRFLYVTTGSAFDDCIYPEAGNYGSYLLRYSINAFTCSEKTLVLDPAFLVSSFDLPSNIVSISGTTAHTTNTIASTARTLPARFGEISFAVN